MKRTRYLGLGVLVALCLAFPAGASAWGGGLVSEAEQTTLQAEGQFHTFGSGWPGVSNCGSWFTAEMGVHAETVVATPGWEGCGQDQSLKANGCKLEFHPGTASDFDIGPPGCGPMVAKTVLCEMTIPSQAGLAATYTDVGEGSKASVIVDVNVSNIKFSQSDPYGGCLKTTREDGHYTGEWELKGFDLEANQVGIHTVDGFGGVFLEGKESKEEAAQPRFAAETYPTPVRGEADEPLAFRVGGGAQNVECDTADLGTGISTAASTLAVEAELGSCADTWLETGAEVRMNSCHYVLGLNNTGPSYVGTVDVACDKEGDAIVVELNGVSGPCVMTIGPQKGLGGLSYANVGEGADRRIEVDLDVKGVKSTRVKGGYFACGTFGTSFSNGTLTGSVTLGAE